MNPALVSPTFGTVTIGYKIPTANKWTNKRGFLASLIYKRERMACMVYLREKLIPRERLGKIKVYAKITSYRERIIDYGNLVAGSKMIPDNLKALGYLYDDRPEFFECEYFQVKCKKADQCTVIDMDEKAIGNVQEKG